MKTPRVLNLINPVWLILGLCGLNLFVMHYYILFSYGLEGEYDITQFIDNLFGICFDVSALYLAFFLLSLRRNMAAVSMCFVVTWLWSFSNVIYSRFFFHYLSLSAISQGGVLTDGLILRCIANCFQPIDLYYLLAVLLYAILLRVKPTAMPLHVPRKVLALLCIMIVINILGHLSYCIYIPQFRYVSYFNHRIYARHLRGNRALLSERYFCLGGLRTIGTDIVISLQGRMELTDEQLSECKAVISQNQIGMSDTAKAFSCRNVVFILVESYMSFTSDMKVGGREVTPFLNSLKHSDTVYYNGRMRENVTLGESSDGQFIYMAGLLPLRSEVTVSIASDRTLHGLPKMLGRESRMVIPSLASVWQQDGMCRQYGFDSLYTSNDYGDGHTNTLNDEQVLQLAMQKDRASRQPFFSVVLTMSMHQPYIEQIYPLFPISDHSMPNDLACYLNACHYTDRQLERYFKHLRRTGLYDNSLIVIAADHPVHVTDFGGMGKEIPFYLVNIPRDLRARMWKGECNQIDVYTTLLDLLGVKSDWHGLGRSLLSPDYSSSIAPKKWDVSEWIIRGDYFLQH